MFKIQTTWVILIMKVKFKGTDHPKMSFCHNLLSFMSFQLHIIVSSSWNTKWEVHQNVWAALPVKMDGDLVIKTKQKTLHPKLSEAIQYMCVKNRPKFKPPELWNHIRYCDDASCLLLVLECHMADQVKKKWLYCTWHCRSA